MRRSTTRPQDHTVGVMDGGDRSRGHEAERGRRGMNAMDRIGALSGAAYVLLANIGSAMVGEGSSGGESPGQRVLADQQRIAENPWSDAAFAVVILAQLAFIVFVGYLCSRVRDAGWLATTALIGGIAAIMANLASVSIVITVFVLRDAISPELARAMQDVDGSGHLVQLLPLGVFVLFASAAALVTRTLGRVMSWAGIAVGATSIVVFAATGLPTNEEFFLWPFLLVLLWVTVISLRFGLARRRTATPTAAVVVEG